MTNNSKLQTLLPTIPPTARLIVKALAESPTPHTIANLCEVTGGTPGHMIKVIRRMLKAGLIVKSMSGTCTLLTIHPDLATASDVHHV